MFITFLQSLSQSALARRRRRRIAKSRWGYFSRNPAGIECLEQRVLLSNNPLGELEFNGDAANAQQLPLGFDAGEQSQLVLSGAIDSAGDQDWYALDLNAGDVLGFKVQGNDQLDTTLSLLNSNEELLIYNDNHQILAHNYYSPNESPLPNLNSENSEDSLIQYVINTEGTYYLKVDANNGSTGDYKLNAVVARPRLESEPEGAHQILFVDFDGVTVNMNKFGGSGTKTLSPLRDFLHRWDLDVSQEDRVIDAILATIEENLVTDIKEQGLNRDFDLEIRNSRDHADEFGINPYVSRVIIGGSRAEAGIPYFAIAEHVDVGNFSLDDDALVTLDRQSAPAGSPATLNGLPLDPSRDRDTVMIELIGRIVGHQASHEVGHNFGNYHTDRDNLNANVMDQGGLTELDGDDGVYGTADDLDIDLGVDVYAGVNAFGFEEPFENMGVNDTLNTIAFGLTTPPIGNGGVTAFSAAGQESASGTGATLQALPASATVLPLGFDAGEQTELSVTDSISQLGEHDWFALELNAGDVLGAAVVAHAQLNPIVTLRSADGTLLQYNDNHRLYSDNFFPPKESPLPRINATSNDSILHYVIAESATYYVEVAALNDASTGAYRLDLVVARPGLESERPGAVQIIYVDFDGARVNMNKFFPGTSVGQTTLSPLSRFLPLWGLDASDEDALIDAVLANIEQDFQHVLDSGINPGADIIIRNSRDHADEYGSNPYVSRLIVGGTLEEASVEEFNVPIFAFAEHVDVGNFDFDDDAIVLLDEFSGLVPGDFNYDFDLNRVPLKKNTKEEKIAMIGKTIGNVGSHEVGHNLGNYHTDSTNLTPGIMDNGDPRGFFYAAAGVGADGVYGTHDDEDRNFITDVYHPGEAFEGVGVNNTLNTTAFGLSTGKGFPASIAAIETTSEPAQSYLVDEILFAFEASSPTVGRPFKASFTSELGEFAQDPENPFTFHATATGRGTHLGRFELTSTIVFSPGFTSFTGIASLTSSNGDQLVIQTTGTDMGDAAIGTYTIIEGSGRFANATGIGDFSIVLNPDGSRTATLDGHILYDASDIASAVSGVFADFNENLGDLLLSI